MIIYHLRDKYAYHWGCSCGAMVKAVDYRIVVSEIELQSRYYAYFRTNTLGKGTNSPYPSSYWFGGARGVIVIVVGNGHGDTSSNPGPD